MKNRLITLMLMIVLVFSYTIPALASIDYNLNTVNTQMNFDDTVSVTATKPFWYKCNQTTLACNVTYTYIDKYTTFNTQSECSLNCPKATAYTSSSSNYSYTTTTTKAPSYTYTTTPNYYNYVNTTTTSKPSYTYTTTPSYVYNFATTTSKPNYVYTTNQNTNYYMNTTTTNPVVFFNNQNINQISNFVTTTTTIPVYTYTTLPRTINPTTTTLPLVSGFTPRNDYVFQPTTTTKPNWTITDQNIVKAIDLKKAIPIATKPIWTTNLNPNNQNLTLSKVSLLASLQASINSLKNDLLKLNAKEDEKLQMVIVGDETKKTATGPLIVVVLEDSEYAAGLPNYIARKESEGYQVKLEKVSNIGKKPEQMKAYFRKMKQEDSNFKFAVIPVDYLSGMIFERNVRIEISDYYYCKLVDDRNMLSLKEILTPDIYVSRANRAMLEKEFTKLTANKMLITFPIMRYMHKIYNEGCWYADLKKADPSRLGNTLKNLATNLGINVKTFYETRGIEPSVNKPDFQLSNENITREATNANFILSSNTVEFTYIDFKNKEQRVENYPDLLTTAIYKFDNGDKFADRDEIELEPITDFSNLNNVDRIGGLFNINLADHINVKFSSYVGSVIDNIRDRTARYYGEKPEDWYIPTGPGTDNNDDGSGLVPSYISDIRFFAEEILAGKTTSEALWNMGRKSIDTFGFDDSPNDIAMAWDMTMYGDPAKSLKDTIEQPKAEITPSKITDESKIEIPMNKTEVEFLIKNIGKVNINYSFEKNNVLDISPIEGNIPVEAEEKIKIKISNNLSITYQSDTIQSTPKQKSTKIYFKSNAGDKEITVTYWGV